MVSWRERESNTQARSREDNECTARGRADAPADGQLGSFRCECGDRDCTCAIRLTLAEYESVRAFATHFAIARNHENPESEQLVEDHNRFAVVETVSGEAVKLARESYPRQWRRSPHADRIELLNGAGTGPRSCPICDADVPADDRAVHQGGELYHPECASRREERE